MGTRFSSSSKKDPPKLNQLIIESYQRSQLRYETFAACNEGDVDWEFVDSFVKARNQKIKDRQSSNTNTSTVFSGSRYDFLVEQRGVSLSWLFSFAEEVFKTHESTITTRDVQRLVVVQETLTSKVCYVCLPFSLYLLNHFLLLTSEATVGHCTIFRDWRSHRCNLSFLELSV